MLDFIRLVYWSVVVPAGLIAFAVAAVYTVKRDGLTGTCNKLTISSFVRTALDYLTVLLFGLAVIGYSAAWAIVGLVVLIVAAVIAFAAARVAKRGIYGSRPVAIVALWERFIVVVAAVLFLLSQLVS